tara:strand:+ start:1588 stop:2064 length:477 start_codon:yes stop_codon:yes gene_type:complete
VIAVTAFVVGVIFAVGLVLGGMTQPLKVIAFLDVSGGAWDPSLALVMGGALTVYVAGFRWVKRRARPVFEQTFFLPERSDMPPRLFVGGGLFGAGWALSGFCPGPALVSVGAGMAEAWYFFPAMLAGMGLFQLYERRLGDASQGIEAGQEAPVAGGQE